MPAAGGGRPRLVLVHGIGDIQDYDRARAEWTEALARGAGLAGHTRAAAALLDGSGADVVFAGYSDLFRRPRKGARGPGQAQGTGAAEEPTESEESEEEALLTVELLSALIEDQLREATDSSSREVLLRARGQLRGVLTAKTPQGFGAMFKASTNALTTLFQYRPLRLAGQWTQPLVMRGHFSQVSRYLKRTAPRTAPRTGSRTAPRTDVQGSPSLDRLVRARVTGVLGAGPTVVVAHSLGSVVAMEALHETTVPVPLLVTIGSPLGTRAVVWPHLRPQPPTTPEPVERWLNFWDRDDVVVSRSSLADFKPNTRGVRPESRRVDSDGLLVHSAVKYLAQPAVAGPVVEALAEVRGTV